MRLFDSGAAVARQLERTLQNMQALNTKNSTPARLFTSGDVMLLQQCLSLFWKEAAVIEALPL